MKSEESIRNIIQDNRDRLKELDEDPDNIDWGEYGTCETEIEVLEWVLK